MAEISTLLPKPLDHHVDLITALSPTIEGHLSSNAPRGLVSVHLAADGRYKLGFTPRKRIDVVHVMAYGLPEESAIEVVQSVDRYDPAQAAAVLLAENQKGGGFAFSYLLLDVRATPNDGTTRH